MSLSRRNAEGLVIYRDILTFLDDVGRALILENAVKCIAVVESPNCFLASVNGALIEELSSTHFPLSPQQSNNIRVFPKDWQHCSYKQVRSTAHGAITKSWQDSSSKESVKFTQKA
jgi:hypothetical protein